MVNYNKSIIYKLCCKDPEITDIYIGSTTDFTKRKFNHKSKCKNGDYNVYKFIREHGNWDNWDMIQVESYKAENKHDLKSRERHWIETLKSTLNKNIPTQTYAEYYQKNKEVIVEYKAEYYQKNKDIITEQRAEYYQNNKDIIAEQRVEYYQNNKDIIAEYNAEYYQNNKDIKAEYNTEYYQKNKDIIAEQKAKYYQKNKDIIAEQRTVKVVCDCGSEVNKCQLNKHKKTKKHLKYLETRLILP